MLPFLFGGHRKKRQPIVRESSWLLSRSVREMDWIRAIMGDYCQYAMSLTMSDDETVYGTHNTRPVTRPIWLATQPIWKMPTTPWPLKGDTP